MQRSLGLITSSASSVVLQQLVNDQSPDSPEARGAGRSPAPNSGAGWLCVLLTPPPVLTPGPCAQTCMRVDHATCPRRPAALFAEYSLLTSLSAGLRGLLFWVDQANTVDQAPVPTDAKRWTDRTERAWWHYTAVMLHADVLFTGSRSSDTVDGAAFRALRDLGRDDLARH